MVIDAREYNNQDLNKVIKESLDSKIRVTNVIGERYIGTGVKDKTIIIEGTPGNAMGAYLNECDINVVGNCQDAIGDTMNSGTIVVYGNCGDAVGYSMRGGEIYIQGNAGYRVGIHMKEYKNQKPVIVVGGKVGDFLGEYQAGGVIIVLGLKGDEDNIVGDFCATGMHGGAMYIRAAEPPRRLPKQVFCEEVSDVKEIEHYLYKFSEKFGENVDSLLNSKYYKLTPNVDNPYKQLYVAN